MNEEELEHTVSSTESPEDVLTEIMTPEKKAELKSKLENLKQVLNGVEQKMIRDKLSSGKLSTEEIHHIVQVLCLINSDLRQNVSTISDVGSRESREEKVERALVIIDKTSTIYEGLVSQLVL